MIKLAGRLVGRLVGPSLTDEPLGLLLRLPLFRLNSLLVPLFAGDGGVVLRGRGDGGEGVWAGP